MIELDVAAAKVRLEERHAAADVAADEVRIDHALGYEGGAHRRSLARMQIRETDGVTDAFQIGRGMELAQRLVRNPVAARSEKAHLGSGQCMHGKLRVGGWGLRVESEERQAEVLTLNPQLSTLNCDNGHWSRDCADTSGFSDRRAD